MDAARETEADASAEVTQSLPCVEDFPALAGPAGTPREKRKAKKRSALNNWRLPSPSSRFAYEVQWDHRIDHVVNGTDGYLGAGTT